MAQGIDCAVPLKPAKAKEFSDIGKQFVARYLVPESLAWKRLTRLEAEGISRTGMKLISVFETTANRPKGGETAGKYDGILALAEAKLVGQPVGSCIYFAVDYDAQEEDFDAIEAYLKAAAAQIKGYSCGVYGSFAVIEEMAERGACDHFWQTYAWSHRRKSNHANVYQHQNGVQLLGIGCDLNESYNGEGWWSTVEPVKNKPPDALGFDSVAAQKVIDDLGALYRASADKQVMAASHFAAEALRKATGIK